IVLEETDAVRALQDAAFDPLRTVILDQPWPMPGMTPPAIPPRIQLALWAPEELQLEVWTKQPGFLVIGDIWYPGWRAWIDGQPAPVLRAHIALRAIPVPAGAHRIIMRYEPLSVRLGLALSGLALMLTLATCWPRRWFPVIQRGL
ncbi:MAG: YfhO family protein, partial [Thermoflexus sp.]